MKNFIKAISFLLVCAMAFGLTSCGSEEGFAFPHLLNDTTNDFINDYLNNLHNSGGNNDSGGSYTGNHGIEHGSAGCYRCAAGGYDICQGHPCPGLGCFRGGVKCTRCGGDGEYYDGNRSRHVKCSRCSGTGQTRCSMCHGSGLKYYY